MRYGELDRDIWPWLSPSDEEWTWQDGHWHTQLRELIRELTPMTLEDLRIEIRERTRTRRRAAAKDYQDLSDELMTVLATLRVIADLRENFRLLADQLMLEARERGASWGDLGWAMNMTRQAARNAYPAVRDRSAYETGYFDGWLAYDVEAARRVAYETAQNPSAAEENVAKANKFLELADTPDHQVKRRKAGHTPPRRYV
jgi:hypothetical protein